MRKILLLLCILLMACPVMAEGNSETAQQGDAKAINELDAKAVDAGQET